MTQFLFETYPINWIIDERGPEMLLNAEFMRMAFIQCGLMEHCPDMDIRQIDWRRLVDNWNLPVKVKGGARNLYRMGEAKERPALSSSGMFAEPEHLPPGMRMSGGSLIVDGNAVRAAGAKDELSKAVRGLLDAAEESRGQAAGDIPLSPNLQGGKP